MAGERVEQIVKEVAEASGVLEEIRKQFSSVIVGPAFRWTCAH